MGAELAALASPPASGGASPRSRARIGWAEAATRRWAPSGFVGRATISIPAAPTGRNAWASRRASFTLKVESTVRLAMAASARWLARMGLSAPFSTAWAMRMRRASFTAM